MSKKTVRKSKSTPSTNTSEFVYKPKKAVPENWTSRHNAVKACGRSGATITQIAKRMKVQRATAQNLVRWLSWNGYVARSEHRAH